jgi:hypothetical protein
VPVRWQYVVVRDALSASDASNLHAALDDIHAAKIAEDAARPDPAHRDIPHRMAIFSSANALGLDPAVLDLIRNTRILPKVVDILGWNISLYHCHANITPGPDANGLVVDGQGRATPQLAQRPPRGQEKTFGWHQDTSRVNIEMDVHPGPRLSVKVAYFLTDLTSDNQVRAVADVCATAAGAANVYVAAVHLHLGTNLGGAKITQTLPAGWSILARTPRGWHRPARRSNTDSMPCQLSADF